MRLSRSGSATARINKKIVELTMPSHRYPFFTSARGRLLSFNLLMVAVTLMVAGCALHVKNA